MTLIVENHWKHEIIQIKLKSYNYFWNWYYWKFVLRLKEMPFLGTSNVKISWGGDAPRPPRRDWIRHSIITIRLLRNFCQLLEKLWTTLHTDPSGLITRIFCSCLLTGRRAYKQNGGWGVGGRVGGILSVRPCSWYFNPFAALNRNAGIPFFPLENNKPLFLGIWPIKIWDQEPSN